MTVPLRTFLVLGLAVGALGAGYVFAPQPGAATLPTASMPPKTTPVANAATPAAKPSSTLIVNRAPVPLATPTHRTYHVPKEGEASLQSVSATSGQSTRTDASTGATAGGGSTDGGLPPPPGDAASTDGRQAKAAIELDGYKNVRALEKGPDGIWRGRAMRGRTEIAIRVDAGGNVSAE